MSTYRTRPRRDFTVVRNAALRDASLSWKAKGILGAMLTYPPDWRFNQEHLETLSTDGRDSLRTGIRELEAKGYIVREQKQGEGGRWGPSDYVVSDDPAELTVDGNPVDGTADGFSGDGQSAAGKSNTTKTDSTKTDLTKTEEEEEEGARELEDLEEPEEPQAPEALPSLGRGSSPGSGRTPPRHSDKLQALRNRHPSSWEALCRVKADREWRPQQFQKIAVEVYHLADRYGETAMTARLEELLIAGDEIRHPIKWLQSTLADAKAEHRTRRPRSPRRPAAGARSETDDLAARLKGDRKW